MCNSVAILAFLKHWCPKTYFCIFFAVTQIPVVVMVPLPMRSYFHSATKKVLDHLRAWWGYHHLQLTSTQVMVQYLVEDMTSVFITMPTVTLTPTPILAPLTLFQVEYKTRKQSWLGLVTSHLMRWRCFILVKSQFKKKKKIYLMSVLHFIISVMNVDHWIHKKERFGKSL